MSGADRRRAGLANWHADRRASAGHRRPTSAGEPSCRTARALSRPRARWRWCGRARRRKSRASTLKSLQRGAHSAGAAGRQYRPGRRPDPERKRRRDYSLAAADEQGARGRSSLERHDRRSRRDARRRARSRRESGPPISAVACVRRDLYDRRQFIDQCRRRWRHRLWQCARSRARGLEVVLASGGRDLNGLGKLRKDNTGYDLKDLFIGAEGHARHHIRRFAETLPAPARHGYRLRRPRQSRRRPAPAGLGAPHSLGPASPASELLPRIGVVNSVLRHAPRRARPARRPPRCIPGHVLIELSSQLSSGLEETLSELLAAAMEKGIVDGRRRDRRDARTAQGVLATARGHVRRAARRGRLDQT